MRQFVRSHCAAKEFPVPIVTIGRDSFQYKRTTRPLALACASPSISLAIEHVVAILEWLRKRVEASAWQRSARDIAERAFVARYPNRRLISRMVSVFHEDEAGLVVQICYEWGGIPPHRSWWRVLADGSCCELTSDEANEIRPVPIWR